MKLRSIETTPSPNCMKLNLDAQASAKSLTLNAGDDVTGAPEAFQKLLAIAGIQSIFAVSDFITLTRKGSASWQPILAEAGSVIGIAEDADASLTSSLQSAGAGETDAPGQDFGQVEVAIQMFRGIPVQVRATKADEQARVALPDRFNETLQRAIIKTGADYVAERIWSPYQAQFGDPGEIAQQMADELAILIDETELAALEKAAVEPVQKVVSQQSVAQAASLQKALLEELQQSDWKRRLKAIQKIDVTDETFEAIALSLKDERNAIRRWAAALLGASDRTQAIQPLCKMLRTDSSPIVRRTAGDALSDLGNVQAMESMTEALQDSSGLVRWRAARFLNEVGNESAIAALEQAVEKEDEFDVRVEMKAAIARITSGASAQLPMWMRISQSN